MTTAILQITTEVVEAHVSIIGQFLEEGDIDKSVSIVPHGIFTASSREALA